MKRNTWIAVMIFVIGFWVLVFNSLVGCTKTETAPPPAPVIETTTLPKAPLVALSWEKTKPERKAWSEYIFKLTSGEYFLALDAAKDWNRFCTKYDTLKLEQRATVMAEFWSALTYYESSWNPKSQAVDVGTQANKDSWSIGLTQISVRDWQNKFKYNFDQLLTPEPNLHLALEVMAQQIKSTGLVILPNSSKKRYWAVILEGNKYQKINQITAMVQKLPFCN